MNHEQNNEVVVASWQRTLYILMIAQLMTAAGFSNVIPFLSLYIQELGTNTPFSVEFLSGMAYSAQALTMMVAAPVWGMLSDRYGRKMMVQRAMLGSVVVVFLMGFARTGEDLVLLRAIQGLVAGSLSAANALIASVAPRDRTGYAMSTLQVGHWAGLALGPLLGGVIADLLGYQQALVITAVLLLLAALLVRVGVVEHFIPVSVAVEARTSFLHSWLLIVRSSKTRMIYFLRFLSNMGRMMIVPILPLFMLALLQGDEQVNTITGLAVGLGAAASTVTGIYLGRLGDRKGLWRILQVCSLLTGLLHLAQGLVTNAWQMLMLQLLMGAAAGGIIPVLSALLARYSEPGKEGRVYGLDNSINAASRAVAPVVGAALATTFGFRLALALSGLPFLAAALLAIWQRPLLHKTIERKDV